MSLESISRVVSHALKAATDASGATPDEKAVLDVLAGLSGLLQSRMQLHKHASPATLTAEALATAKVPAPAGAAKHDKPATPMTAHKKEQAPAKADDSYELK
jgi:hypothetical protein